jgi:hypothetical protein
MLDPLSDVVVASLRTSETAALAAAMVIAGAFPEVLAFAAKVIGAPPAGRAVPKRVTRRPRRDNGHGGGRESGMRKRDDKLAAIIRETPTATIGGMARLLRVAKNTVRDGLERLEIAGVLEREGRSWRPAEPRPVPETPKWTAPVSARRHPVEERAHA